jgi:hypothetical protein
MDLEELEARVKTLESIEEIKKLQRSYGYYIEYGMVEEVVDLFSDSPNVAFWHSGQGAFRGKKGIRRYFESLFRDSQNPEFLHQVMQLSGIVDVDADGKTAKGRWYGLGAIAIPRGKGVTQVNIGVIYENDYVKENGKWKIKILRVYVTYDYQPGGGIVKPERVVSFEPHFGTLVPKPDIHDDTDALYPSGYIVPFHFEHPITGKKTSGGARNTSLKKVK